MSFQFNSTFLKDLGVLDWGYTESSTPTSFDLYDQWSERKENQDLAYLIDERKQKRRDIKHVYPEYQSSLFFTFGYAHIKQLDTKQRVAGYVSGFDGVDYHFILKEKLRQIFDYISHSFDGEINCKLSIDTLPVLERDFAYQAGLGWFGKNSMLIHREHGSYFMISAILLDQKLKIDKEIKPSTDFCGTCTDCIQACPTLAIDGDKRQITLSKCLSTFTIEKFKDDENPPEGYEDSGYIYGCDICQDVCPWNKKVLRHTIATDQSEEVGPESFFKRDLNLIYTDLENMSNRQFRKLFKSTPFERTGRIGVMKNIKPYLEKL